MKATKKEIKEVVAVDVTLSMTTEELNILRSIGQTNISIPRVVYECCGTESAKVRKMLDVLASL